MHDEIRVFLQFYGSLNPVDDLLHSHFVSKVMGVPSLMEVFFLLRVGFKGRNRGATRTKAT